MRLNTLRGTVGAPDRFRQQLGVVVAAGALVRLVYLATKWNRPLRLNDSVWYSAMADGLRQGRFFHHLLTDGPSAEHPPLASLLMAPGSFLPNAVQGQRLTSAVAGVVAVALIGLLGRRIGGPQVGLVAATIAAVYPNLWLNDGLVMSESFAIALVAGALLALHALLQQRGLRRAATAGALLGLCALTRSELVLLTPLAAVLVLAHGRNRAAAVRSLVLGATAVAVMLPWVVVNLARFERPVLLTTNDGTTLLGSYCDDIFGGANKGGWSVFCVFDAPDPGGDDSVRSAAQRSLAVQYARAHVREIPGVVVARVARATDLYGLADMVHGDVGEEKPRPAVWAGIAAWWLLAPLAGVGLAALHRRDRWLLALPLLVTATATVVFYGGHRLRSPAEPVVV
ncbi:MAG: glycosyltransferase family 39 protein, partial [Actinomycetota bacterium]|nr:glycosyltransferase family 39 protein [Actinomycetota bacterium]